METTTNEKIAAGVVILLTFLAGFGGNDYLDEDMLEDVFVCTSNERLYECTGYPDHLEPLSPTAKSCYGTDAEGNNRRNICRNGVFMPIVDYAESQGVNPMDLVKGTMNKEKIIPSSTSAAKQYSCPPYGEPCYPKV